jgi:signal transduction histidine kinase
MTRRTLAYLACQAAGWSVWGSATLVMFALSNEPIELRSLAWSVLGALVGFGISHAYRMVIRRRRWVVLPMRALAPRVIAASIVCGFALDLWVFAIGYATQRADEPGVPLGRLPVFLFNFSVLFVGWSLIYFSVHWLERSRNADRAQLAALKSQLNPHFLFNALNSVRGLVTEDPPRAQAAITRLAKLLRAALGTTATETVTLARELEVVDDYLALEAVRLEDRLRVTLDIADDARDAQVPALLVQTLVENAIKHGVARRRDGGEVSVRARIADRMLAIDVANTAADAAAESTTGVGLANASERLQLLFGPRATLALDRTDPTRVVAHARIPLP